MCHTGTLDLGVQSGQKVLYKKKFNKGYRSDVFIAYFVISETAIKLSFVKFYAILR
jgi:hypothetical protein